MDKDKLNKGIENCPDCGRYLGALYKCPYCGGEAVNAGLRRRLLTGSLVLAVAGLFFLYMMSIHKDIAIVAVRDITPVMNYAGIRVAGTVTRRPYISYNNGTVAYISFSVDDGSGILRVSAADKVAAAIAAAGRIPHRGDYIDVAGRLSVRGAGHYRLRILAAGQLVPGGR